MRTVFIVFSRGVVARNVLRTDLFGLLTARPDVRFILIVPKEPPAYFREEARHPRVEVVVCPDVHYGRLRTWLYEPVFLHLAYSATSRFFLRREGRLRAGSVTQKVVPWPIYAFKHLLFSTLSRFNGVKRLFRRIDARCFPDRVYEELFDRYAPDLVFAAAIACKRDAAMVKAARRRGIATVGMTRSWDNLDRLMLPVVPDTLIVQTEIMRDIAVKKHAIPADRIRVTGFPQFDLYRDQTIIRPREEFLRSLGLDPARKVILYGSEGSWGPHDEHIVRILQRMITEDALGAPCSLIIRPHFSDIFEDRFQEFKGLPNVHVDANHRLNELFVDRWDPSRAEMEHLANEFKHTDVLVSMASTLALEAAMFDVPIVNVDFYADTEPDHGPYFGRWYDSVHYGGVVATGGVRMVRSPEEMRAGIAAYLAHPEADRAGRKILAERYCQTVDGTAAAKVAAVVLAALDAAPARPDVAPLSRAPASAI